MLPNLRNCCPVLSRGLNLNIFPQFGYGIDFLSRLEWAFINLIVMKSYQITSLGMGLSVTDLLSLAIFSLIHWNSLQHPQYLEAITQIILFSYLLFFPIGLTFDVSMKYCLKGINRRRNLKLHVRMIRSFHGVFQSPQSLHMTILCKSAPIFCRFLLFMTRTIVCIHTHDHFIQIKTYGNIFNWRLKANPLYNKKQLWSQI